MIRTATLVELARLEVPRPPARFPVVWAPGDGVVLRSIVELEARAAILHLIVSRVFGMPADLAARWLLSARLLEEVTPAEWEFISTGTGDRRSFGLQFDALYGLAWLLGLVDHLDPSLPCPDDLAALFPDLHGGESYASWQTRTLPTLREPDEAAALLDLYYCLSWVDRDDVVIRHRRWALEWAVIFTGPYHEVRPPGWADIDLSA